ncbi:MAG: hypothetical protein CL675_05560 [Bdellovibrionaceae bacterium]|nr:hypothetical protein [Pseudobdellovibrionaceae bacterium]
MELQIKVLQAADLDTIMTLEKSWLQNVESDPMRQEMISWKALWRKEALEHYLPLGWSFGLWSQDLSQLKAYLLAQPLLFFRGMTQTLWIEHIGAQEDGCKTQLIDVAYRMSRSKHFQAALYYQPEAYLKQLDAFGATPLDERIYLLKTSKLN